MELIRQPIFLLLMTASASFEVFLACIYYFGLGEEPKLIKNSALAVMFVTGLFGAVTSASSSVGREIRTGTALAVLSKPVGRAQFLLAKYCGLAGALLVLTYVNCLAALLATRMSFDSYGSIDWPGLGMFAGGIVLAFLVAGFGNFFLRRTFVSDAVIGVVAFLSIGFFILHFIQRDAAAMMGSYTGIDWRVIPASYLILLALLILAALALACSTRLDVVPTLAVCSGLFLLGLISDYFWGTRAEQGSWWASILYAITPNWQLFWVADVLEGEKQIPAGYLIKALAYAVGYIGATLAVALALFEDRELN